MTKQDIQAMKRQLLSEMEKEVQLRINEFQAAAKLTKPGQFLAQVMRFNELMKLCHQFDGLEKEISNAVVPLPLIEADPQP